MASIHAPEARPLANATTALEDAQEEEKEDHSHPPNPAIRRTGTSTSTLHSILGSRLIPEAYNTVEKALRNNPNYGPGARPYIVSRSAAPQQQRENQQPTPPLPSESTEAGVEAPDNTTDSKAHNSELRSQLFDAAKADLFYTLTRSKDSTQPKTAVLNICAVQKLAVYQLQYDISCYVGFMYRESKFYMELQGFPPLADLMNKYCKSRTYSCDAVRNLDYMKQCAMRGYEEDPFLMKSSRALERSILEATQLIPNHVLPTGPLPLARDHDNIQLRELGRNEANRVAFQKQRLARFAMAALGGLLLVVPMLIMANVQGKASSLITTCIALLVFSALVTLFTELGPHEILATTAAYAAVLVVFVGTSLASQTVVIAPAG